MWKATAVIEANQEYNSEKMMEDVFGGLIERAVKEASEQGITYWYTDEPNLDKITIDWK